MQNGRPFRILKVIFLSLTVCNIEEEVSTKFGRVHVGYSSGHSKRLVPGFLIEPVLANQHIEIVLCCKSAHNSRPVHYALPTRSIMSRLCSDPSMVSHVLRINAKSSQFCLSTLTLNTARPLSPQGLCPCWFVCMSPHPHVM